MVPGCLVCWGYPCDGLEGLCPQFPACPPGLDTLHKHNRGENVALYGKRNNPGENKAVLLELV